MRNLFQRGEFTQKEFNDLQIKSQKSYQENFRHNISNEINNDRIGFGPIANVSLYSIIIYVLFRHLFIRTIRTCKRKYLQFKNLIFLFNS